MKKDTQCVHSGTYVDPETRGINTPVFTSSSFEYLDRPENVYPHGFLRNLILIRPVLSLGGVETIVCAPVATSHAKLTDEQRAELGVTGSLMRLSVGIEDVDDLVADIEKALS